MKQLFVFLGLWIYCFSLPGAPVAEDSTFMPLNPPEMKRLSASNSPAYQAAKLFLHGTLPGRRSGDISAVPAIICENSNIATFWNASIDRQAHP